MSNEWKWVPVILTDAMREAYERHSIAPVGPISKFGYEAMLDAAPVAPAIESMLETWTAQDQEAFANFLAAHFPAEMDSFAIQSLGSAWKDGQSNAAPVPPKAEAQPVRWMREGVDGDEYCEKPFTTDWTPLYDHANAAEVERLRVENDQLRDARDQIATNYNTLSFTAEKRMKELETLRAHLAEFLDCPYVLEEATIPRGGIEVAPNQVVETLHVSLGRMLKLREALSSRAEVKS